MDLLKILDDILVELKRSTETTHLPKEVILNNIKMYKKLSNRDRRLVFEKLMKDEYIEIIESQNGESYYITFNGLLFLQKGGYVKENSRRINNDRFKKYSNILLFVASTLTIIYTSTEIHKYFHKPNDAKSQSEVKLIK